MSRFGLVPAAVAQAAAGLGIPKTDGQSTVNYVWSPKFDELTVANDGTSPDGDSTLRFFQGPRTSTNPRYATNVQKPNQLADRSITQLLGLCFSFKQDPTSAAAATGVTMLESLRDYIDDGLIVMKINGKEIFVDKGLFRYSAGGGLKCDTGITEFGGAMVVLNPNNGEPNVNNRFRFPTPIFVEPNEKVELHVEYPAKLPVGIAANTLRLRATFDALELKE